MLFIIQRNNGVKMLPVIVGIGLLLYTLYNTNREISQEIIELQYKRNYDSIYLKYGEKYGLDPELLKAHAIVESNENALAKGPTNDFGLMQVVFPQKLSAVTNWYLASEEKLLNDPDYNVDVAAQIMAWNHSKYPFDKAIAIYNSWGARNDPDNGPFRNQAYVDKVVSAYTKLLGSNYFPTNVTHVWR